MFDSIKRLFGGKPGYEIVQAETKTMASESGPKHVLLLAANLQAKAAQAELVRSLIERFKVQRMLSPPDTSMLLITVIGPCDPSAFLPAWRKMVAGDQIAGVWMSKMEKADVAMAPAAGDIAPHYQSLLPT